MPLGCERSLITALERPAQVVNAQTCSLVRPSWVPRTTRRCSCLPPTLISSAELSTFCHCSMPDPGSGCCATVLPVSNGCFHFAASNAASVSSALPGSRNRSEERRPHGVTSPADRIDSYSED